MSAPFEPFRPDAERFCKLIAGAVGPFHFRVVYPKGGKQRGRPTNITANALDDVIDELIRHNRNGASIFLMMNATDGKGYSNQNVTEIRCVFADLDGAPLDPVLATGTKPHLITETSPGKYHVIWLVADCPLDRFKAVQKAIAKRFESDPSVCDLARVLRVPGFWHLKGDPFRSRIVDYQPDLTPYTLDELVTGLGLEFGGDSSPAYRTEPARQFSLDQGVGEGQRATAAARLAGRLINQGLDDDEALTRLRAWNALNQPPLDERELADTLRSIRRTDERNRAANDDVVERFNRRHAIIHLAGKTCVARENADGVDYMSPADFHLLYRDQPSVGGAAATTYWLNSPAARRYREGVIFDPSRQAANDGYYNLFKGFAVEPREGDCSLFLRHVREVIAAGDETTAEYILDWMADAIQNPGTLPGVALVLRGNQGTGKGIFVHYFGRLYGRHYLHISQAEHLTGRFNAHQAGKLLVFADEVVWGGDKRSEGALKALITEATYVMEAKGKNPVELKNCRRVIMATNEDWAVPAGPEERRFMVLDVSDVHMQDEHYFGALAREMEGGGPEALLHFLLERDLSRANIRKFPRTSALLDQKIRGLSSVEHWWYDCLYLGQIASHPKPWEPCTDADRPWPDWLSTDQLYRCYLSATETDRHGRDKPRGKADFIKAILKVVRADRRRASQPDRTDTKPSEKTAFPGLTAVPGYETSEPARPWGYALPPLDECRAQFSEFVKQPILWDN